MTCCCVNVLSKFRSSRSVIQDGNADTVPPGIHRGYINVEPDFAATKDDSADVKSVKSLIKHRVTDSTRAKAPYYRDIADGCAASRVLSLY